MCIFLLLQIWCCKSQKSSPALAESRGFYFISKSVWARYFNIISINQGNITISRSRSNLDLKNLIFRVSWWYWAFKNIFLAFVKSLQLNQFILLCPTIFFERDSIQSVISHVFSQAFHSDITIKKKPQLMFDPRLLRLKWWCICRNYNLKTVGDISVELITS